MPVKKLLLYGNANHQFNTNYVKWLRKVGVEFQIDVLSDRPIKEEVNDYYGRVTEINFGTFFYRVIRQVKGLRRLYSFLLFSLKFKSIVDCDCVHVQILNMHAAYFVLFVKKYTKARIIISIWGSDYYQHNKKGKHIFLSACNVADKITFTNEKTKEQFIDEFKWNKNNLFLCRFGLAPLELLAKVRNTKIEAKKALGWDHKKLAITIGYNLSPFQQHLKILKELYELKVFSDQIEIVLPITYAGSENYKKALISKLNKLPFDYFIYDQFLSDEKIAQLRWASDIMVQLQVTDQFSGSMQEHLFARNVVITGSWLPYQTMIEYGIEFIRIDSVENLSDKLETIINQYDSFYLKTDKNPEAILELSSWESNILNWVQLYQ